jgi:hypothetical protein
MIIKHGSRYKGRQHFPDMPPRMEQTLEEAFESLTKYELAYGGRVVDASSNTLVIQTRIMSCIDTTTFTGSDEEMAPLLAIALEYERVLTEKRDEVFSNAYDRLAGFGEKVKGSPLFITHLTPLLVGSGALREAARNLVLKYGDQTS